MNLAIFDIDGTLTETNEVDDECFVAAFAESYRISDIETDWTMYKHVTDSGILSELFERKLKRAPQEKDFAAFKRCFVEKLKEFAEKDAKRFVEIRHAKIMLERLRFEKDWAIALATGAFYDSAELKLSAAKINIEDFPVATADDAASREEILQIAIGKSLAFYGQDRFEKTVSIGDGVWDARTARNLNLDFIGIAGSGGERAEKLRREGAELIIEDFSEYKVFLEYLNK